MSNTRVRVARSGQERTSRSFARRHAAFAIGELLALLAALALAVIVRRHPGPLPGDVGVALALQHFLLPHHWLASLVDGVSAINWPVPSAIVVAGVVGLLVTLRRWLAAGTALLTSALADASSSNFQGLIRVNKTSLRTDSNLENRNLLLSDHSKAESDPRLEILNSDVIRCAHGATVGPLDPETIFYIQTRGVPGDEAKRLVVEAFFDEVLQKIPVQPIRLSVWRTIQRKLGREVGPNDVPRGVDAWQDG